MKLKTRKDIDWLVSYESKTLPERQELALQYLDYQVHNGGFLQWQDNGYQKDTLNVLQTIDASDNENLRTIIDMAMRYDGYQDSFDQKFYDIVGGMKERGEWLTVE